MHIITETLPIHTNKEKWSCWQLPYQVIVTFVSSFCALYMLIMQYCDICVIILCFIYVHNAIRLISDAHITR